MKKNIKILDTTLRDGSYAVDFQFTARDTAVIASALDDAGFDMIEIGHGLGLNASNAGKGKAASTDEEYLEAASSVIKKGKFGIFFIPGIGRKKDLKLASKYKIDFVRIGTNAPYVKDSEESIKEAKNLGMFVSSNLMKSYVLSPQELAKKAKLARKFGTDIVVVVDSAGGLLPEDVEKYIKAIREETDVDVGFHGHNNLSMAIANTVKAIQCGAVIVDTSLQGIGRSAGNAPTEILPFVLQRLGYKTNINVNKAMDIGYGLINPLIRKRGISSIDVVSGFAGFHSSYLNKVLMYARKYSLDPRDIIIELCKIDRVSAPSDLLDKISKDLLKRKSSVAIRKDSLLDKFIFEQDKKENEKIDLKYSISKFATRLQAIAKKTNKLSVFTIVTSGRFSKKTVLTRYIHEDQNFVIGGAYVYYHPQLKIILKEIDGIVDYIFIDSDIKSSRIKKLVEATHENINKSRVFTYKHSEIYINSIINTICQFFKNVSDLKIAIIGIDSLAIKLAVELIGMGAKVILLDKNKKNIEKNESFVRAANIARISAYPYCLIYQKDIMKAVTKADVLIGFTPMSKTIDEKMINNMSRKGIVIDGGFGSIYSEAIKACNKKKIKAIRPDFRAEVTGKILSILNNMDLIDKIMGKKKLAGVTIVAGGILANRGDVVVDSISNPTKVIGVASGSGDILREKLNPFSNRIKLVEDTIRIKLE